MTSSVTIPIAAFLLVVIVESSAYVRLPLGLLLAIAMLASGMELLPIALIGAAGVTVARLMLALSGRRGRERLGGISPEMAAQRSKLRAQLASSPGYARTTFVLGALPGVPANVILPLLGAMRAPLGPVLFGTLVGRTPVLAFTTAFFAWVGAWGDNSDEQAIILLGAFALALLVIRTIRLVDWQYRADHGVWRLRDPDEGALRMMTNFSPGAREDDGAGQPFGRSFDAEDDDVVEGELLGEEVDDDEDDDSPPPALPPSGLAPS